MDLHVVDPIPEPLVYDIDEPDLLDPDMVETLRFPEDMVGSALGFHAVLVDHERRYHPPKLTGWRNVS